MSDLARILLVILTVSGLAVGGAYTFSQLRGPVDDDVQYEDDFRPVIVVGYTSMNQKINTAGVDFPASGVIDFPALFVPIANVTSVSIMLLVNMNGVSSSDNYNVDVEAPGGEVRTGQMPAGDPPTTQGYRKSEVVIAAWARAATPENEPYETGDAREALRWSAENRTDRGSIGSWLSTVSVNPPPGLVRSGNASLQFSLDYYTGVIEQTPIDGSPPSTDAPDAAALSLPFAFAASASIGREHTAQLRRPSQNILDGATPSRAR